MARFSPGTMTAVIFAILIGLGGAYAVRQYLHNSPVPVVAETPAPPRNVTIPVAGNELLAGRTISLGDVQIVQLTPAEVAKSKFAGKAYMANVQQLLGRTLIGEHKKGEPFLPEDFYPEGMGPSVVENLRAGYRAIAIPIKNIQAVAGFARPGAMVDVYYRSDARDGNPEMALTLLERVEILAVGETSFSGQKVKGEQGSVTVAVTAKQAKALKIVEGKGDLTLALRRQEDNMIVPVSTGSDAMTLEQLLGLPPARRVTQMEIFKAGNRTMHRFDEDAAPNNERRARGEMISTPIAAEFPNTINTSSINGINADLSAGGGG